MPARTSATLSHVETGAGVPVLAVHGWTPDHRIMLGCLEPVFARRPGYRRLYPDLPGMGATPAPASVASSDDVLDTLLDFIDDHLRGEPFLLVGESYGGYLARAVVRDRPGQVLGLALICSIGTALDDAERTVPRPRVLRRDPAVAEALADEGLAGAFEPMAVVQTPRTAERFRTEILPGLLAADHDALGRIAKSWRLTAGPDPAEPFDRPALVLAGRQDHCVGYVDQWPLLEHYPRATFAVLDVAGHNLQIEQPVLFEALMGEWLDRVAAEAGS